MPTYGYECLGCGNGFEVMQSIKDDPLSTCDDCGGALRKRVYPVGIAFKGSGFYVNDYAAQPASSSSEGSSGGAAEAKSDAKTDAKPEAAPKPEAKADVKTETKSEPKTPAPA